MARAFQNFGDKKASKTAIFEIEKSEGKKTYGTETINWLIEFYVPTTKRLDLDGLEKSYYLFLKCWLDSHIFHSS